MTIGVWTAKEFREFEKVVESAYAHSKKITTLIATELGPGVVDQIPETHSAWFKRMSEIEDVIDQNMPIQSAHELLREWANTWTKIGRAYLMPKLRIRSVKK